MADQLYASGIRIPIDYYLPPNTEAKAVRINGILEPLYQAKAIWHYRGGNCQILEDELVSTEPLNDDTKDAWAMCVGIMEQPMVRRSSTRKVVKFHPRFGGIAI